MGTTPRTGVVPTVRRTVTVTVTAGTLVRDLLLQADRPDAGARADRGLVTLLPAEQVTIGVSGWETPDAAVARSALYCVEPTR